MTKQLILFFLISLLTACGFHLRGQVQLSPRLHHLYLKALDPYGELARNVENSLKRSDVTLASSPAGASAILVLHREEAYQQLTSGNTTQQTRQYNLIITVQFEIQDNLGNAIIPVQTLSETRSITIQSSQILGTSNETSMMYNQMRTALAYAIMNRLGSTQISQMLEKPVSNQRPIVAKPL